MLFTSVLSLLVLAAVGQSAPTPSEIEDRVARLHCVTKFSGKLSGAHHNKAFSFTRSGNLVTYSGDQPTNNVLTVEFQACSDASGNIKQDGGDWIGRLRIKNTNSCIDLSKKNGAGLWLPKIATCNSKTLTDAQTWRYDTFQFGLFWAGFFNFGNPVNEDGEVCRAGYEQTDDGNPTVTSHKQIEVGCAKDDSDVVRFWKLL